MDISKKIHSEGRIYSPVNKSIEEAISIITKYGNYPKILWLNGDIKLNGASIPNVIITPNGEDIIVLKSNDPFEINIALQEYIYKTLLSTRARSFLSLIETAMGKKITQKNKDQIDLVFKRNPAIAAIGTKEEYRQYLLSIFPESVETSIYWHGSNSDFSEGFQSAQKTEGSGAPEVQDRNDMYFNKQAYASIQYVNGQNRTAPADVNGFAHWNKLYWELKEILSNGVSGENWRNQVIDTSTIRKEIPNKRGEFDPKRKKGKTLDQRKRDYGYGEGDEETEAFFREVFGIEINDPNKKITFNEWVAKNKKIFKDMEGEAPGLYPVILNIKKPIREEGQDTYYEGHRRLFTKAAKKGNDAIIGARTKNEFGSDVVVMLNLEDNPEERVHFLGTTADLEAFAAWKQQNQLSTDNIIEKILRDPFINEFLDSEDSAITEGFDTLRDELQSVVHQAINDAISTEHYFRLEKVISGGQTGVDTAGVTIARELGFSTGGTVPVNGLRERVNGQSNNISKEDMVKFGFEEVQDITASNPYTDRTRANVQNSDGTVYILASKYLASGEESAGYKATSRAAMELGKPFAVVHSAQELREFVINNNIRVLNIAGSRGSSYSPGDEERINSIIKDGLTAQPWITKSRVESSLVTSKYPSANYNTDNMSVSDVQDALNNRSANMVSYYGKNKANPSIPSNTFEAILTRQRTATTRFDNLYFWTQKVKIGDIVAFKKSKDKDSSIVFVRIKSINPINEDANASEWSSKEGWSQAYFKDTVIPKIREAKKEGRQPVQIEYEYVGAIINNDLKNVQGTSETTFTIQTPIGPLEFRNQKDLANKLITIRKQIVGTQTQEAEEKLQNDMNMYAQAIVTGILPSGRDINNDPVEMQTFINTVINDGNC